MNMLPFRTLPLLLLLAGAGALTACARDDAPASAGTNSAASPAEDGFITRSTRNALEKARRDMAENNISVGGSGAGYLTGRVETRQRYDSTIAFGIDAQ